MVSNILFLYLKMRIKLYDPTFNSRTLQSEFRNKDFIRNKKLIEHEYQNEIISKAKGIAKEGFAKLRIEKNLLKKKTVCRIVDLPYELVLRRISRNIKRVTSVKQLDRVTIIKCLSNLLSEGYSYRIYKLDISNFYESFDIQEIIALFEKDTAFSNLSINLLNSFFTRTNELQIKGLPRGTEIRCNFV